MTKTLVQEQFGKTAASYLTSTPHALGKSLERLVALTAPQKTWRVLDIATGGGHVAYTFAPHVERVWATDITQEMLDMVKGEAAKRGLANLRTTYAKAEALPFEDASFDLVTCRIAPHHFDLDSGFPRRSAPRAQSRAACSRWWTMWCRPAASAITSTPSSASAIPAICAPGPWTNGARRSKRTALPSATKSSSSSRWNSRAGPPATTPTCRRFLRAMLAQATPEVKATLEPKGDGAELTFRLCEGLFIAKRVARNKAGVSART